MARVKSGGLRGAAEALAERGAQARPYECRVEAACNAETAEIITLHADASFRGSKSDAIRDLIARGAASLAIERA